MTIVYLVTAWFAGIAVQSAFEIPVWAWALALFLGLVALFLLRNPNDGLAQDISRQNLWRTVALCGIALTLGAGRMWLSYPRLGPESLGSYNDQGFVTIEGLIIEAPDVRDTHVNLRVRVERIFLSDGSERAVNGIALVQAPRVADYRYGFPVRITGELNTPPEFDDFSYRDYLARQGVYSLVQYAAVEVTGERQGNPARAALLDFRSYADQMIKRLVGDPQASLLAGILLGIESGISESVREAFSVTGAAHVIAISGSNLVILGGLLQTLARRFAPERWAAAITIAGMVLYALFVGGDPPVIRAALMASLGLIASQLGRQTWGLASLAFSGWLMTVINPQTLFDVGFQLSFMATLGLILYVEPLQTLLEKLLAGWLGAERIKQILAGLSDAFIVTIAAQITTTPIIALYFGQLSLASLPVNLLIVPAQGPLMVLGGIGVLVAMIVFPLGQVITWGSWVFVTYTLSVVRFFARLPFASIAVNITPTAAWAFYAGLIALTAIVNLPAQERQGVLGWLQRSLSTKVIATTSILISALLLIGAFSVPDGRLHLTFAESGGASAVLIETPTGRTVLVNAGRSSRTVSTLLGDSLPFWQRRLDLVVLTQPGREQTEGLLPLLDRYQLGAVMTNGVSGSSAQAQALEARLIDEKVPIVTGEPGTRVVVDDGVTITVVQTQVGLPSDPEDIGSALVMMVSYKDAHFLLAGDLAGDEERSLLASPFGLDATVLQVPRGGPEDSATEPLLEVTNPQVAIIVTEAGNRAGLPHPAVLERLQNEGIEWYRTDESGLIHLATDGSKLWVFTSE